MNDFEAARWKALNHMPSSGAYWNYLVFLVFLSLSTGAVFYLFSEDK